MKKAIIFDLDGTLWQVIDETLICANKIANKYHQNSISKDTVCNVFGKNRLDASKLYFPNLDETTALSYTEEIELTNNDYLYLNGGTLYDGVKETIKELSKNYSLFIVSNTAEVKYIQAFLHSSNLAEYFVDFVASGKVFNGLDSENAKAEGIVKVIKENNIDSAVYVGDTLIDQNASKKANIPFIWAKYGFNKDLITQYSINNFSELTNVIKNIF